MKHWLTWKHLIAILACAFLGLALCCIFGQGSRSFVNGGWGVFVVDAFAAIWTFALTWMLFVKLPGSRARKVPPEEIEAAKLSPVHETIFYANHGSLPKWMYLPFIVIAALLVFLSIFCVTLCLTFSMIQLPL